MIRHIGRRLLLAVPTLLAVFTIIFIIVRVAPGDPAVAALGDYASADAVAALGSGWVSTSRSGSST